MGSNDNPFRGGQSPEPEDNNQANLPPWLREDASASPQPPPAPPPPAAPPPPQPSAEDENLPPWLREQRQREMLQGETLSDDWLSSADRLVESVDTELTYDEWYAMQKESARPKSIEEEVPDLLSDVPDEPDSQGTGPVGTGELPDWFLGLEELDTSDAPDWLVSTPEPVAEAKPEEPPSWINDVADTQEASPGTKGDAVDDFFSSLNSGPTLPSGESMDDLFGEFAMSAPETEEAEDEEELPALDWVTGQADVAEADANYGAAEMETFFSNLSQSAQSSEAAHEEMDVPTLDWMTAEEEPEDDPATQLDTYLDSLASTPAAPDEDIGEPELDLFTSQRTAAYPLPDIEFEPEEEETVTQDPGAYTEETMSWLNELQGIVSAVTREDEEEVAATPDDFFSSAEEKVAFEESVAGRGDEFDWPELEPEEEPEPEESDWLSQLDAATGTSEMDKVQLDEPDDRPAPKLTGMLNRMRRAEQPPEQAESSTLFDDLPDREVPPTPDDDLESLFMTEDLLSESKSPSPASSSDGAGFDTFAVEPSPAAETYEPQWSAAEEEPEPSGFGDDLTFDLDALMSEAPSQTTADQDEVDFNLDDVLAGLSPEAQDDGEASWGASSDEDDSQTEDGDSFNFDDLLGGLPSDSQGDSSWDAEQDDSFPQDALTDQAAELNPADWGSIEQQAEAQASEPEWEPAHTAETEQELYSADWGEEDESATEQEPSDHDEQAYDLQPLTAEAVETYESQWGVADEESPVSEVEAVETYEPQWGVADEESEEESPDAEAEAYDVQPLTAEAAETYEPQWGVTEEQSPDSEVEAGETYEPKWGAVLDAEAQQIEDSVENTLSLETQENLEEAYEPEWGASAIADEAQDEQFTPGEYEQSGVTASSMEGTGALDDMSWLTDDIFAETRGLPPLPQESPKIANAEWIGDGVFEQEPLADDQPAEAAQDAVGDEFTAAWETDGDEAQASTLESDEEFLAALEVEMPSDAADTWETDGDEAQASTLESDEEFLAALEDASPIAEPQHEDAALWQAGTASWETDGDEVQASTLESDEELLAALEVETPSDAADTWETSGDEAQAETVETADDFLATLEMLETPDDAVGTQQAEFNVESRRGAFDDDFLASLDTLDQMQASGQSHVGEDLFSSWDDQQINLTDDDSYASPQDQQEQIEVADDILDSLEFDASLDMGEADAEPEGSEDFLSSMHPDEQPPESEQPEFGEDFFGAQDMDSEPEAVEQPEFGEDFFVALETEDQSETSEPAGQPEFDEEFFAQLETSQEEDEQPQFDQDFYAAMQSDAPLEDEPAEQPEFGEESFAELETPQPGDEPAEAPQFDEEFFAELETHTQAQTQVPAPQQQPEFDEEFFAALEAQSQPEDEQPQFDEDFYAAVQSGAPAEDEELPAGADFLSSLASETQDENEDFYHDMGMVEADGDELQETPEWLTEAAPTEEQPASGEEDFFRTFEKTIPAKDQDPDWLTSLTDPSAEPDAGATQGEAEQPDDDMWLVAFDSTAAPVNPFVSERPEPVGPIEDLDSYLASLHAEEAPLSANTQAMLSQQEVDFDTLLDQPLLDEEGDQSPVVPFPSSTEPAVTPDWLTDVQASVGEVSAGAIVRQLKDRPEGELDDRLKKLRKRAKKLPAAASADKAADPLADVLPEMEESLRVAPIRTGKPSAIGALALTSNQQGRVALLKSLVTTEAAPKPLKRLSAIDLTYDSPYMPGLEDEESAVLHPEKLAAKAAPARTARRVRRGILGRVDRLLVTLLLAGGILGPFLASQLRIGSLPPSRFVAGSAQSDAFLYLDGLPEGALVLFAIEYSPASSAELDPMTDALLRHVLMQNAYPVVISGNPIALLRTSNLFTAINQDDAFRERIGAGRPLAANADYFLIRYIPGGTIGLRAFSEATASLLLTDIRGQTSGLNVQSLRDFPVMVVLADRAEDVRGYAEQVAPLADATVIAAVSYSAAPLVEPYVNAEVLSGPASLRGMLVGYGDAYTYSTMIGSAQAVERGTQRPEQLLGSPETSELPEAPPEAAQGTAVVIAAQAINVRPEPNTNNSPIAQLQPGDRVEVIGFDDSENWVNIRLSNGTVGWVSTQLVQIEAPESALPKDETAAKANHHVERVAKIVGARHVVPTYQKSSAKSPEPEGFWLKLRPLKRAESRLHDQAAFRRHSFSRMASNLRFAASGEPSYVRAHRRAPLRHGKSAFSPVLQQEEETEEPTPTTSPTPTPRTTPAPQTSAAGFTVTLPPHSPDYRDERWYGMTLGIIVSATVIGLGAVMNIIRSILRRRR